MYSAPVSSAEGVHARIDSAERNIFWAEVGKLYRRGTLKSTTVDAGNTPTTSLREGLLLAKKTSDGLLYAYDNDASDGTEEPYGILEHQVQMLGETGAVEDKQNIRIVSGGCVRASQILGLDAQARTRMRGRFLFDDEVALNAGAFLLGPRTVRRVSGNTTVVAADNGVLFITDAATNFTLPTKAIGLSFMFTQDADANMAVLSAGSADDIIHKGDAGADSVTFSTANEKIGSCALVLCCSDASGNLKWRLLNLGGTTATVA